MRRGRFEASPQACWNCANATKPWKCPWVGQGVPVEGWTATPTQIKMWTYARRILVDSYDIRECPLFDEDSFDSGRVKVERKPEPPRDRNYSDLIGGILAQAVEDWKSIEYGALASLHTSDGTVHRDKLYEFFWSGWFETLVMFCTEFTPDQIREKIRVPKRGYEPWLRSKKSTPL